MSPDDAELSGSGPRGRLAAALRPIIAMTVSAALDDEVLTEAADALEALAASMDQRSAAGQAAAPATRT